MLSRLSQLPDELAIFMATRTSLAIILFTSFFSSLSHHKINPLDFGILKQISAFVIIGTLLGIFFVSSVPGFWLEIIFVVYVSLISLKMWFGFKVEASTEANKPRLSN